MVDNKLLKNFKEIIIEYIVYEAYFIVSQAVVNFKLAVISC